MRNRRRGDRLSILISAAVILAAVGLAWPVQRETSATLTVPAPIKATPRPPAASAPPATQIRLPAPPARAQRPPARSVAAPGIVKPLRPKKHPSAPPAASERTAAHKHTDMSPVIDGSAHRGPGRTLLKLLEHGKGPVIEIAWPDTAKARNEIYHFLTSCVGIRTAVMDGREQLFVEGGVRGAPWRLNSDQYSGFLRTPAGADVPAERRRLRDIITRHRIDDGRLVRVFPRRIDAVLLGGLATIAGPSYATAGRILGAYRLDSRGLFLHRLRVDGRPARGIVKLTGKHCTIAAGR